MRYYMAIDSNPLASLPLSLFGVSGESAYVDLLQDKLIVRAGSLFNETFSLSELGQGERFPWPWYYGVGIRTDFQGIIGPVTNTQGVVAIPLLEEKLLFIPLLGPVGLQLPCKKIVFSLKDPDTFLTNFNQGRPDVDGGPKNVVIE
ncbi:MAG: hypothetical protein Q6L68_12780 [Thermostichus sp. DG02_5_bins_236]